MDQKLNNHEESYEDPEQRKSSNISEEVNNHIFVIVLEVGLETDPAELMLALAAGHVVAAAVLPDQHRAVRAWLGQQNLAEVVGQLLKVVFGVEFRDYCPRSLKWVTPGVVADITDEVVATVDVLRVSLRQDASATAVGLGTLANVLGCHTVAVEQELVELAQQREQGFAVVVLPRHDGVAHLSDFEQDFCRFAILRVFWVGLRTPPLLLA